MLAEEIGVFKKPSYVGMLCLFFFNGGYGFCAAPAPITIYTRPGLYKHWAQKIDQILKRTHHIELQWVVLEAPILMERLRLEGQNTQADLIFGVDSLMLAKDDPLKGLFAKGEDADGLPLKKELRDNDFNALPFSYAYLAFVYDSSRLKNLPPSWEGLLKSDFSFLMPDPRTSEGGAAFLLWTAAQFKERYRDVWTYFSRKVVTYTKNWTASYALFLKGEAQAVLAYTTTEDYHRERDPHSPYKALIMQEGHPQQIWYIGITHKGRKNPYSKKILEIILSPEIQSKIYKTMWCYPALEGVQVEQGIQEPKKMLMLPLKSGEQKKISLDWLQAVLEGP